MFCIHLTPQNTDSPRGGGGNNTEGVTFKLFVRSLAPVIIFVTEIKVNLIVLWTSFMEDQC